MIETPQLTLVENTKQRNIKLTLSWNGEQFQGYQYQPHAFTVQQAVGEAWQTLTRETVALQGCSRLDAGVHAFEFVLNFYTQSALSCEKIVRGLNGIFQTKMQLAIRIYSAEDTDIEFHARFNSCGKHYRYLVWFGFASHAFLQRRAWHLHSAVAPCDVETIFKQFEGKHDFSAFRSSDCSAKTTERTILRIDVWKHPLYPELFILDFWGNGFLKNMIRNLVGTGFQIATKKLPENTIQEAFFHQNRARTGMCAPAQGLALMRVYYDNDILQKEANSGARWWVTG